MFQALGAWGESGEESCFWPCCFWKELWRILLLRWWIHEGMKGCLFEKWKRESRVRLFATPWTVHSPWNSPGKNTGVGSCSLLLRIFPTQELNWGLLHCRWILSQLRYQGSLLLKAGELSWPRWVESAQRGAGATGGDLGGLLHPAGLVLLQGLIAYPPQGSSLPSQKVTWKHTHTHTHTHTALGTVPWTE